MKGVILASAGSAVYVVFVTAWFWARRPARRAAIMGRAYWFFLTGIGGVHLLTPVDLGFLPSGAIEKLPWIEFAFAAFIFSASVFGGWLQLYNLAERGLSLRILIDALNAPGHAFSVDDVIKRYADGKGIRWMYDKRLDDLLALDLVRKKAGRVLLTGPGIRISSWVVGLRRIYRTDRVE